MSIADPATHTDHEIGAEAVIARQRAEIERLRAALEEIVKYDCGAAHEWCRNTARKALTAAKGTTA